MPGVFADTRHPENVLIRFRTFFDAPQLTFSISEMANLILATAQSSADLTFG